MNIDENKIIRPALISVVTVVYNGGNYIEKCIESVVNQSYAHIEYIIIDGASTDDTVAIIKKYENQIAHWMSEPDTGIYDAMNKALRIAKGDWIFFLGADDVLFDHEVIAKVASSLTIKNGIYYGNALFKSTQKIYDVNISKWFLCLKNISHQTVFYPKELYKKYQYELKYRLFADHIYNINLFTKNQFKFIHLPIITVIYNDEGSSSNANDPSYFSELPAIVWKAMGKRYGIYVYLRFKYFFSKKAILRSLQKLLMNKKQLAK